MLSQSNSQMCKNSECQTYFLTGLELNSMSQHRGVGVLLSLQWYWKLFSIYFLMMSCMSQIISQRRENHLIALLDLSKEKNDKDDLYSSSLPHSLLMSIATLNFEHTYVGLRSVIQSN